MNIKSEAACLSKLRFQKKKKKKKKKKKTGMLEFVT